LQSMRKRIYSIAMNKHIQNLNLIRAHGLTQTQIAERIGVTQATVSRIANGELEDPRASVAEAIAELAASLIGEQREEAA